MTTVALLHFDGADTSTTFTDATGRTWTAAGAAQIRTDLSKFGGAAGQFTSAGARITTPDSADLRFGTDPWTVEGWFRPQAPVSGFGGFYIKGENTSDGIALAITPTLLTFRANGTTDTTATVSLSTTDFTHIAFVYDGASIEFFAGGTSVGSAARTFDHTSTAALLVGNTTSNSNFSYRGRIDDLRIKKGTALYTADFTPPTAPFPNEPDSVSALDLGGEFPAIAGRIADSVSALDLGGEFPAGSQADSVSALGLGGEFPAVSGRIADSVSALDLGGEFPAVGIFKLGFDLRQVVSWRLHFDLRQVVTDPPPYTLALDLRQVVYEVTRVGFDLRQVVSVPTVRLGFDLRRVVSEVYRVGVDLRQVVGDGLVLVGPATQRVQATVLLGGVDVSAAVTGVIEIDREEGAAAVAEFTLLPATGPIDLVHWLGAPVRIEVSVNADPPQTLFVGRVTDPAYDAVARTTTLRATDGLQNVLDAAPEAIVDLLAGGYWSAAVFAADATGAARAQDRLSTIPESLDLSPEGAFRRTPWAAKASADYTFTPASIVDQSLRVEPGPWREMVNTIELTVELRYTRHRHRQRSYHWVYEPTFHNWIVDHTSLPTQDMIRRAAEAESWRLTYEHFVGKPVTTNPQTGAVEWQVINGVLWLNDGRTNTFVLEATLGAYVRWDETVTETYALTVQAPASVARFGAIDQTDYVSLSADDDGLDWTASPPPAGGALGGESAFSLSGGGLGSTFPDLSAAGTAPNGDIYIDTLDVAAAENALVTALARARTRLLAAHRANSVDFTTPLLPGIDLIHTARVDTTPVTAQGKVRQVIHRIDSDGEATTTVRLAVSQASDAAVTADPLAAPPRLDTLGLSPAASVPALGGSETHLGRRWYSPEEDPGWTGYVGNYDLPEPVTAVAYTERFVIDWGVIDREPVAATRALPHTVAVPHELLEIAA